MSFRKPCHMPFRKLIPPFTLTVIFALDAENEKSVTDPRLTALNSTVGPYQFCWILTCKLTLIVQFYFFQAIPFWYYYLSRLPDHVITVTNENRQGWLMFFEKDSPSHTQW